VVLRPLPVVQVSSETTFGEKWLTPSGFGESTFEMIHDLQHLTSLSDLQ